MKQARIAGRIFAGPYGSAILRRVIGIDTDLAAVVHACAGVGGHRSRCAFVRGLQWKESLQRACTHCMHAEVLQGLYLQAVPWDALTWPQDL